MERYECRIEIDETIARELLWRALAPEGVVMTPALRKAIAQQQKQLGFPAEGYRVAGISSLYEQGVLYAEIEFVELH
jgi:hypothetical protein